MKIDVAELNKRIEQKLINVQKHPSADLYIYNYSKQCQYAKVWDDYTMMARGLILDGDGTIVARPFRKFFNYGETGEPIPADESFKVYEKLDGSLGILYHANGFWQLATRGSFASEQAFVGTRILSDYLAMHDDTWIDPAFTYLFEIIYPENRIVVNYGTKQRLPLLAKIHTETGQEADIATVDYADKSQQWYDAATIDDLKAVQTPNAEGFVLVFDSGFRLKLKFDEYVRLHAIVTGTSSRVIWELLAVTDMHTKYPQLTAKQIGDRILYIDKRSLQPIMDKGSDALMELIQNAPDEMQAWITDVATDLQAKHDRLLEQGRHLLELSTDPKVIAQLTPFEWNDNKAARAVAFFLLGDKIDAAEGLAWKHAYPEHTLPFREDTDG